MTRRRTPAYAAIWAAMAGAVLATATPARATPIPVGEIACNGLDDDNDGLTDEVQTSLSVNCGGQIEDGFGAAVCPFPTAEGTLRRLRVRVNVSHARAGDLVVTLLPPTGPPVLLFAHHGGDNPNLTDTVFDLTSPIPVGTGTAPFTGAFLPDDPGAMGALLDLPLDGQWALSVADTVTSGDPPGFVGQIALEVEYSAKDTDNDGSVDPCDCAPNDGTRFPSQVEIFCDGVDQNCNGLGDDDDGAPVITCPADIQTTVSGSSSTTVTYPTPVATDVCLASVLLTSGTPSGGTFYLGPNPVTFTATDALGHSASCTFNVLVLDATAPFISCPSQVTATSVGGACQAVVSYEEPTALDANSTPTVSLFSGIGPGGTFPVGVSTEKWIAEDPEGNTAACSFPVIVNDGQPPAISNCPAPTTLELATGSGTQFSYVAPTAVDGCTSVSTTFTGKGSGATFPLGNSTEKFTFTDGTGLASICAFTVKVVDSTPPALLCPPNQTVPTPPGACSAVVTFPTAIASDLGGVASVSPTPYASGTVRPVGQTDVQFVAVDNSGNTGSCTFQVSVVDQTAPTVACPANITVPAQGGTSQAVVTYPAPTAQDNCAATVQKVSGPDSGASFPLGTTSVTWKAVDPSGNQSTPCTFSVTVVDDDPPVLTCPTGAQAVSTVGQCSAVVSYATPTATDNGGGVTVTRIGGLGPGSTFPVGPTLETWKATDSAGNEVTCSFVVHVTDGQAPTIVCPAPITAEYVTGGTAVTYAAPAGADNCSATVTQVSGQGSGATFALGVHAETWRASDAAGQAAECSFEIRIQDTVPPVIQCPADVALDTAPGVCGRIVTVPEATASDASGVTLTGTGFQSGTLAPTGTSTQIWTAVDTSGNSAQCTVEIVVTDNESPVMGCPADIDAETDPGKNTATVVYAAPTRTDNCTVSPPVLIAGLASGAAFPIGSTVVTHRVTDPAGNQAQCSFTVNVTDPQAPKITCPANFTTTTDNGICAAAVTYPPPTATDNDKVKEVVLVSGPASGASFPLGTTSVTWRAEDAAGNAAVCSFSVTVVDDELPVITCPGNIQDTTDPGLPTGQVTFQSPVASDNCGTATVTQSVGLTSGSQFPVGQSAVAFSAKDPAGNIASCNFQVTMDDEEPPVATCPPPTEAPTITGQCSGKIAFGAATATDNHGVTEVVQIAGPNTGSTIPVGQQTVSFQAVDLSGNTGTCSTPVTVVDHETPTISCPGDIAVQATAGNSSAKVSFTPPVTGDNCPGQTTKLLQGLASGAFFPLGTTHEVFEVKDGAGNTATCDFDVTVVDTQAPVITCPADILATAAVGSCAKVVTYTPPVGTDNAPGAQTALAGGLGSGGLFPVGKTNETYRVTDAEGNTSSCSFSVTVVDQEAPEIVCPPDLTVPTAPGKPFAAVTYSTPTLSDNCAAPSGKVLVGLGSGGLFPVGTTTVTWQATDGGNNTATCAFKVTVKDQEPPKLFCPPSFTRATQTGTCSATIAYDAPLASDNHTLATSQLQSGPATGAQVGVGVHTVTWRATDVAGNQTVCSFDVTVIDGQSPTITCPADKAVTTAAGESGAVVTYAQPTSADNCAGSSTVLVAGLGSGATFPLGTTAETWRITDGAGASATCTFYVTVDDGEPPKIACPPDISAVAPAGACGATVSYTPPVGTDNGPGAVTTRIGGLGSGAAFPVGVTTESWQVKDSSGLVATCSLKVTVTDEEAPSITCPDDIVAAASSGQTTKVIWQPLATTDNCPGQAATRTEGPASGSAFELGETVVSFQVADVAGNTAECSFKVTVTDGQPPQITCPKSLVVGTDPGACSAVVAYQTPTAKDNAAGVVVAKTAGLGSGAIFPLGVSTEVWRATDGAGATAACSFTVTVVDTEAPKLTCPADVVLHEDATCTQVVGYTPPAPTDNCAGATADQVAGLGPGVTFGVGTSLERFRALDLAGNAAECSFTVKVTCAEICDSKKDENGDGLLDCQDPSCVTHPTCLEVDFDGDGVATADEEQCGTDPTDPTDTPTQAEIDDPDGDGKDNCADDDDDGDGLPDTLEAQTGTDPLDDDSDDDGLLDGEEDADADGTVGEGETDPRKPDTDGDGLNDGLEAHSCYGITVGGHCAHTLGTSADTDGDGLSDGAEDRNHNGLLEDTETDPTRPDTDQDGVDDGTERMCATDPLDVFDLPVDLDGSGVCDGAETDSDGDGFVDGLETLCQTDPGDASSKPSLAAVQDPDGDGILSCADDDDDGDGVSDAIERICGTDATKATQTPAASEIGDTDGDGTLDCADDDDDDDGLRDVDELLAGTDPKKRDTDGDGLTDGQEVKEFGTDPKDTDTDRDGIPDGDEVAAGTDPTKAPATTEAPASDCLAQVGVPGNRGLGGAALLVLLMAVLALRQRRLLLGRPRAAQPHTGRIADPESER